MTIKELRTKITRETQREMAKRLGVSQTTINNWEHGDYVFGNTKKFDTSILEKVYGIDFSGIVKPSSENFRIKEGFKIW